VQLAEHVHLAPGKLGNRMEEVLKLDPAPLGIDAVEVVDAVRRVLPRLRGGDVLKCLIHRVNIRFAVVEERQQRIEIRRGLPVKTDEQIAMPKDGDVGLLKPDRHANAVEVELPDAIKVRGS
jgi:hypothetical protein